MAHNLQSLERIASYSAMLLVHLLVSLVNWSIAAYLSLISDGEINMAAALALPQALSQYIIHGDSGIVPSVISQYHFSSIKYITELCLIYNKSLTKAKT
jgi:hypothetical protein